MKAAPWKVVPYIVNRSGTIDVVSRTRRIRYEGPNLTRIVTEWDSPVTLIGVQRELRWEYRQMESLVASFRKGPARHVRYRVEKVRGARVEPLFRFWVGGEGIYWIAGAAAIRIIEAFQIEEVAP